MLAEEFIDNLCRLGLTRNQARVYLIIASKTKIRVPEIADLTGIHEQDIYKILPKLEEVGLITKTTTKPIIVEALFPEIALQKLIKKQQENLDNAKKNTQEIIETIKSKRAIHNNEESEEKVIIFKTDSQSYENDKQIKYNRARKSFDALMEGDSTKQRLRMALPYLKQYEKMFIKRQIKLRILSRYRDIKDCVSDIDFKQLSTLNIEVKTLRYSTDESLPFLEYCIIDGKEVSISFWRNPFSSQFKAITTDCWPLLQIAQEHFERAWQDSNAELIFSTNPTNDLLEKNSNPNYNTDLPF